MTLRIADKNLSYITEKNTEAFGGIKNTEVNVQSNAVIRLTSLAGPGAVRQPPPDWSH